MQGLVAGPFNDPDEFALTLCVHLPPAAGFLAFFQLSPVITIDKYNGLVTDGEAPHWIETVGKELKFWQRRCLMVEMMLHFAQGFPQSTRVRGRVRSWCRAVSVSGTIFKFCTIIRNSHIGQLKVPAVGLSTSIRPRKIFVACSPRNTRRHKLRSYDLSFEEGQVLRKSLADQSPLRRKK